MDTLTTAVELGVGAACIVLGAGVARMRPGPVARAAGWLLAIAGVVAVAHAFAAVV